MSLIKGPKERLTMSGPTYNFFSRWTFVVTRFGFLSGIFLDKRDRFPVRFPTIVVLSFEINNRFVKMRRVVVPLLVRDWEGRFRIRLLDLKVETARHSSIKRWGWSRFLPCLTLDPEGKVGPSLLHREGKRSPATVSPELPLNSENGIESPLFKGSSVGELRPVISGCLLESAGGGRVLLFRRGGSV